MKLFRTYVDSAGQSRWGEIEVDFNWTEYAPPAPPMCATDPATARAYVLLHVPQGWDGGMHNTPVRQIAVVLSGKVEIETSDGEIGEFDPGGIFLMEDTTGVGHKARNVGDGSNGHNDPPAVNRAAPIRRPRTSQLQRQRGFAGTAFLVEEANNLRTAKLCAKQLQPK